MESQPKILLLDVETSFKIAGVWGLYKQDISMSQVLQDMHILCWSAKWLEEDYIYSDSLHYHKDLYEQDPTDDTAILENLWELMDKADYVIAHNGARFDKPIINARFIQKGLMPPSAYQMIDTLKVARRVFRFTSNRLGDLGQTLGVGGKVDTGGFQLWYDVVVNHSKKAADHMVYYCERDIELLEDVYLKLRPWDERHPSTVILGDLNSMRCNVCKSPNIKKNGSYSTNTQIYQKYKCTECGHNMRSRKAETKTADQKENLLRSI